MSKRYDFSTFLQNIDKISEDMETKQKKEELGKIVSSLQRPFAEVMASVYMDQKKQVDELYKLLGWKS